MDMEYLIFVSLPTVASKGPVTYQFCPTQRHFETNFQTPPPHLAYGPFRSDKRTASDLMRNLMRKAQEVPG